MINLKIAIYQSYVHNTFELFQFMSKNFAKVVYINHNHICNNYLLSQKIDMFVMPGGADLYYVEKLNGEGNRQIKNYIAQGGIYLGICAGAYYGSQYVKWAENEGPQKIFGARELAFFKGETVGPVYEFIEDGLFAKSHINAVKVSFGEQQERSTLLRYEGGPLFYPYSEFDDSYKVLATYSELPNNPVAVVECYFEKGMALLSSPHFETSGVSLETKIYKHNNDAFSRYRHIAQQLKQESASQQAFWDFLMTRIHHQKEKITNYS